MTRIKIDREESYLNPVDNTIEFYATATNITDVDQMARLYLMNLETGEIVDAPRQITGASSPALEPGENLEVHGMLEGIDIDILQFQTFWYEEGWHKDDSYPEEVKPTWWEENWWKVGLGALAFGLAAWGVKRTR